MALRKQAITIAASQVDSALTDFPVLVTRDHLDDEVVDPSGSNAAQTDGGDLKFYSDSALTTRLPCEVVQFQHDSSTGAGDADVQVWVKVPSLSASVDTAIYVSYNEDSVTSQPAVDDTYGRNAVWSNNFSSVYHFEEDPSGSAPQIVDSVGANDATSAGSMTSGDLVAAQVGNGLDFDGSNDNIDLGTGLSIPVPWTFSCWLYRRATGVRLIDAASGRLIIATDGASGVLEVFDGSTFQESTMQPTFQAWSHVAVTATESSVAVYLNGSDDVLSISVEGIGGQTRIGSHNSGTANFANMILDDAQLATEARSAAWIAATYRNANDPATFATAGTPEDAGGATPVVVPPHLFLGGCL